MGDSLAVIKQLHCQNLGSNSSWGTKILQVER